MNIIIIYCCCCSFILLKYYWLLPASGTTARITWIGRVCWPISWQVNGISDLLRKFTFFTNVKFNGWKNALHQTLNTSLYLGILYWFYITCIVTINNYFGMTTFTIFNLLKIEVYVCLFFLLWKNHYTYTVFTRV